MAHETCHKVRYPGKREAENALKKLHRQTRSDRGKRRRHRESRVYQCEICHGWHMTKARAPHGR
jgi:hypothetical protein